MHLPTKFHHPMFNCSEAIALTNIQTKQIHKQVDIAENIHLTSLCYTGTEWQHK